MNVLSLFDGISCGRLALEEVGIHIDKYFACEIDKNAIKGAKAMFPSTEHLGSVTDVKATDLPKIDLIIGGSPCQSFSRSGDGSGFDGSSKLFWEYVRLLEEVRAINPNAKFLLENVVMKQEWSDIISEKLRVKPILIDSKLVSAQKRQRLYWTNIDGVEQPTDRRIPISDVLDWSSDAPPTDVGDLMWYEDSEFRVKNATKQGYLTVNNFDVVNLDFPNSKTRRGRVARQKANTLNTSCNQGVFIGGNIYRLTAKECGRLQTIAEDRLNQLLMSDMTDNQLRHAFGNGWTVDVIAHIFSNLTK